ncbi:putative Ulp1 protease family protein [Colletotrichum tofieldiae]|nr:putative Ulp1 protease family protein [Colletotrichum tofieldiae]
MSALLASQPTFVTWTLHHVDLETLCLVVEAEQEASLTRISSDLRGRLTALAARFHATPTLFCWLFGTKLAKSRPTLKLLNDLKNIRLDLSLVDLYTRFDHISRAKHPASMAKTDNSIIKQAIQYYIYIHFPFYHISLPEKGLSWKK